MSNAVNRESMFAESGRTILARGDKKYAVANIICDDKRRWFNVVEMIGPQFSVYGPEFFKISTIEYTVQQPYFKDWRFAGLTINEFEKALKIEGFTIQS